jgi:retinol dehydrogenase 12
MNSMKGKIALVTGSADGIGKQTVVELAILGATVLLHARDAQKGQYLLEELQSEIPAARFDLFIADFELQMEVEQMAAEIKASYSKLDVLVNNAAMCQEEKEMSYDTIEKTFAVNHLAPFLLTHLLLPLLRNAPQPRVINLSSELHFFAKFDIRNLQGEKKYNGIDAYCCTKLCNLLFTYELAARLKNEPKITVNAVHPGMVATDLYLKLCTEVDRGIPEDAADTVIYLSSAQEAAHYTGEYFISRVPMQSSYNSYSGKYRRQLWELSEQLARIQTSQYVLKTAKTTEGTISLHQLLRKFFTIATKQITKKVIHGI